MIREPDLFDLISDVVKLVYGGGFLLAILFFISTLDPLWFIAIFVLDGAFGILLLVKVCEYKWMKKKDSLDGFTPIEKKY